jgi:hypothetical protein
MLPALSGEYFIWWKPCIQTMYGVIAFKGWIEASVDQVDPKTLNTVNARRILSPSAADHPGQLI